MYFDILTNEFYTGTERPYNYVQTGTVIETRLSSFLSSIASQYTTQVPVPTFDETQSKIQICVSPVESKSEEGNVFKLKYGYVVIIPRNILNAARLFRTWAYALSDKSKIQSYFNDSDNFEIVDAVVATPTVVDLTLKDKFYTFNAIADFKFAPPVIPEE